MSKPNQSTLCCSSVVQRVLESNNPTIYNFGIAGSSGKKVDNVHCSAVFSQHPDNATQLDKKIARILVLRVVLELFFDDIE